MDAAVRIVTRARHRAGAPGGIVCAALVAACLLPSGPARAEGPGAPAPVADDSAPEVVARVDGHAVPRAEWRRLLASPIERSALVLESGLREPDEGVLEWLALRRLIHRRLLLEEAGRRGLTVTPQELDQTIGALRRRFADLQSFGAWMEERGLDDRSLFDSVRSDILMARVTGALVEGVRVDDAQVREYYDAHREELKSEEVWLQVIAVDTEEEAREIQAALGRGENFAALARERSLGRRAARGGDVGWVAAETLWPEMHRAVASLRPGEAIGPLPRDDEYLVVRLHDRRRGGVRTLAEAETEVRRRLLFENQQDAVQAWLARREEESEIEVLLPDARADPATPSRGAAPDETH